MNYIGSKYSLLTEIERVLEEHSVPCDGVALDLFAGTGVVAQFLKKRGHVTYANDWQYYSYLTCVAYLEHNELPLFAELLSDENCGKKIAAAEPIVFPSISVAGTQRNGMLDFLDVSATRVLSYLAQMPGCEGSFYHAYCEGGDAGRLYFSRDNGLRIQAIRDQIKTWSEGGLLGPAENAWLIACLVEGADRAANTASVYGAYLKRLKASAQKPLELFIVQPTPSDHNGHKAFCENGENLVRELKTRLQLVYIDPPYNARQYNGNYHILETIARWDLDEFSPRGVTGLRTRKENCSDYCSKHKAAESFDRLIGSVNAVWVLFSYNNEGLVSRRELESIFDKHCSSFDFHEVPYKRFRADRDHDSRMYSGDSTVEYLILGRLEKHNREVE